MMKFASVLALSSSCHAERDVKCHGLAISSGKSHGPYQAGAIAVMLNETGSWDAVSGVTEGALNAFILSQSSDAQKATQQLTSFWSTMGRSKVYDNYALGMLEGLVFGDSLFDAKPLHDLIDEQFGSKSKLP